MRRTNLTYLFVLLFVLVIGTGGITMAGRGPTSGLIPGSEPLTQEAYFQFDYPPEPETFIIRLTDPAMIQQARGILNGTLPAQHIGGTIVKTAASYNPPWGYHLDPDSIYFFSSAIEVCDAGIRTVQEHLVEVCGSFLPGCAWCPWGSRLLAEMTLPSPPIDLYLPLLIK